VPGPSWRGCSALLPPNTCCPPASPPPADAAAPAPRAQEQVVRQKETAARAVMPPPPAAAAAAAAAARSSAPGYPCPGWGGAPVSAGARLNVLKGPELVGEVQLSKVRAGPGARRPLPLPPPPGCRMRRDPAPCCPCLSQGGEASHRPPRPSQPAGQPASQPLAAHAPRRPARCLGAARRRTWSWSMAARRGSTPSCASGRAVAPARWWTWARRTAPSWGAGAWPR
jgi:hypothetical protein